MKKNYPYRKLEDAWSNTEDGIELKYPIFHHNPSIPSDPIIKRTLKEVIGDIDFYGFEGNKEDRIVDSTGKVFIAQHDSTKGYTLSRIPIEYRYGAYPGQVERTMKIEEIKEIMISGIEFIKVRIDEDLEELKTKVNSMNSEEILNTCGKYF